MKIGIVRRGFSPTGGAEAYLRRFVEAAASAGHACTLYTTQAWPDEWPGEIVRVVAGRGPAVFADRIEAIRAKDQCDALFSLERIHACDVYRAGDGVHAHWLERRAEFEPAWRSWLRRFQARHRELLALERELFHGGAAQVVVNSHLVGEEIVRRFGCSRERVHLIRNGVPFSGLPSGARPEVRRELGLVETDYVLLFAGSGWERKGLRFAIEATNRVTVGDAVLLVAGRGNPHRLPSSTRVRFLGPRDDMPRLLAAADAFLLPTIYEPFSNACLEALAAGLPVITTACNGFAEIIEPGTEGEVIAEPRDVEAIARAVEAWASRERRERIRERLRATAARYSIEENVRQTLALIERGRALR